MSLVSFKFIIFIAIAVVTYYVCVPKYRWGVILAANVGFFLSNSTLKLFGVFTLMSLAVWIAAIVMQRGKSERIKTAITSVVIFGLLTVLICYKEISFFIMNGNRLASLMGFSLGWTLPEWIAPLGISYFTLILIGYLLDVRWGTIKEPQKNPLKMLAFAGYFPHMTSGPFTRYNDVNDFLFGDVKFRPANLWSGLQRILWGMFKVVVLSTRLSVLVTAVYDAQQMPLAENQFTGIGVLAGAVLYVLNLYMNFSGSMDIVIGVSELFGIPLAENFQRPFSATSLSEVWRKWHMTLGFWLKDYVLYPVLKSAWINKIRIFCKNRFGKKASKTIPTYIGMLITWSCVGFWHGGSWKYICGSGLFFFVMIVGGLILEPVFKHLIRFFHINTACSSWRGFQRVRTFLLFSLSVSVGRAASLTDGLQMWKNLFSGLNFNILFNGIILNMGLSAKDLVFIVVGLAAVFWVSHLQETYGSVRVLLSKQNFLFRVAVIAVLFAATFLIGPLDTKIDFIYGNF